MQLGAPRLLHAMGRPRTAVLCEVRGDRGMPVLGVKNRRAGILGGADLGVHHWYDKLAAGDVQPTRRVGKIILYVDDDQRRPRCVLLHAAILPVVTASHPVGQLTDVLSSACALLGVPGTADRLFLADRVGEVDRIVVLLVDGLGYHLLPAAAAHAPTLAAALAGRFGALDELTCSFPSTTPTSLVTLGTGVTPGEHGILGFTLNVPGTDRVLTHITWTGDPPVPVWQPVPTLLARAEQAGLRVSVVSRPE